MKFEQYRSEKSDQDQQDRPEIDNQTMKLIVGLIALSLPFLTNYFSPNPLDSISASYWAEGDWSRNIFVGFLFAIGAFLLSYNGYGDDQRRLSKVAAFAAVAVAMFPCNCGRQEEIQILSVVHYVSAAVMFGILAKFCHIFLVNAWWEKGWVQARVRALVYAICGLAIVVAILSMAVDSLTDGGLSQHIDQFTFYAEASGLIAFGIAWLTASRTLPFITHPDERFRPFQHSKR